MTRTVIQKLLYLATLKGLTWASYDAHYYGPYSPEVASTLEDLASAGFLRERTRVLDPAGDPWEVRKYEYSMPKEIGSMIEDRLTKKERAEAGELQRIIELCEKRNSLNPKALAAATKVLYILYEQDRELTYGEIADQARKLGWKIGDEEIQNSVVGLLADLSLATP